MGGPTSVTNFDYVKDIVQAKLAAQRAQLKAQQEAEAAKAKKNTEAARKKADQALRNYHPKAKQHQQKWVQQHGNKWDQKAWWADWQKSKEGQKALGELAPHTTAYTIAAQNELRLAAEDSPEALKKKVAELKGRDPSNSLADKGLDEVADDSYKLVAKETPELRAAIQNDQLASAAWAKAQDNPNDPGFAAARTAFFEARGEYLGQLGLTIDKHVQKGLKAGQKPEEIKENLKAIFGDDVEPMIEMSLGVAKNGPKVEDLASDLQNKYKANPNDPSFSPTEKALADKGDFHTLAFLGLSKVKFGEAAGAPTLTIDGKDVPLSKQEQELAKKDPLVLSLLKLSGVSFAEDLASPDGKNFLPKLTVESEKGPQPIEPGKLPADALNAWKSGDYAGFALALFPTGLIQPDPQIKALMGATSQKRLDWTTEQVQSLMDKGDWRGAQNVLLTNMDAAFSLDERAAIWMQAGLPHFDQTFIDKQIDAGLKMPDGAPLNAEGTRGLSATTMYGDRLGLWMQDFLKGAPPELANLVLDRVKAKFDDSWYKSNAYDSTGALPRGKELFKGLSMAGALTGRSDEIAAWLTDTSRGNPAGKLLTELRGADPGIGFESLRLALKDGADPALASALLEKIKGDKQFANMAYDFGIRFDQGTDGKGSKIASQQHLDFSTDPAKRVQAYFDHFLGDPNIGREVKIDNRTQLRNIAGRAMGFAPNENIPQATKGDTSVSWYSPDSREYKIADVLADWIFNQGGANPTIVASPAVYDSEQGGVQYAALFQVKGPNGQVIIDGKAAQILVDIAEGNPYTDTDDQKANPWQAGVNWHYTSFKQLQEDSDNSDEGMVYFIGALNGDEAKFDLTTAGTADDRHVQWASGKAGITTAGERWKTAGSFIAMGVMVVGGVLLAAPSAGTSLTLVGAGLTVGGLGTMGALTVHDLAQMNSHGQSISWTNPAARSMYINLAATTFSAATVGLGTATKLATISGTKLAAKGLETGSSALLTQGTTRLQTAQTLAGLTRPAAYTDLAIGTSLMGGQAINLAENWDQMTDGQRRTAFSMLAAGFGGMVAGGAAVRITQARTRPQIGDSEAGQANMGNPGTGEPQPVRYVASFDAQGNPSLGLLGPDGRTTADVNAPWSGEHPPEILVAEMAAGLDGLSVGNAVHRLIRNPDGTYAGVRLDADGGLTRYTTGEGEGHPLAGIQLFNTTRRWDGHSDPGAPAEAAPFAQTSGNGGDIVPIGHYRPGSFRVAVPAQGAEPIAAGGVPPGGRPPITPRAGGQPGDPYGGDPLDLGYLTNVDPAAIRDLPSRSRGEIRVQGQPSDHALAGGSTVLSQAYRILDHGGTLVFRTGQDSVLNPITRAAMRSSLQQLGFENIRVFRIQDDESIFGEVRATKPALPTSSRTLDQLLQDKIDAPDLSAYRLYSRGNVGLSPVNTADPLHLPYLRDLSSLAENRPAGGEFISQLGRRLSDEEGGYRDEGEADAGPLLHPLNQGGRVEGYPLGRAVQDFFHYLRAGADPATARERIYINAGVNHAPDVMGFIVRNIVDDPQAFPGVTEAKIAGSHSAAGRRENIVIYIDTPENRQRVLAALDDYADANPTHFRSEVPPMTQPVRYGIATGEEPNAAMIDAANTILGRNEPDYSFGQIRGEAIDLAHRDTLAQTGKPQLDASDLPLLSQNVATRLAQFGVDPANPSRNLPESGSPARTGDVEPHSPVEPSRRMFPADDAEIVLGDDGWSLTGKWGLVVRDIDPGTGGIRTTELHQNELVFFDPKTRQTFGRSPGDGTPALSFTDGARVYHPGTKLEYVYNAERGRFEPLGAPKEGQLFYDPKEEMTYVRAPDGTLEPFGMGNYTVKGRTWTPSEADAPHRAPEGSGWHYDQQSKRTLAPDENGDLQPLDPDGALAIYNEKEDATYLIDPASGQVQFFGKGDNRTPAEPGNLAQRGWAAFKGRYDLRGGSALRFRPFGQDQVTTGPTVVTAGRSLGTKTGVKKPHKSDRWWELKNAPIGYLTGYTNQQAFQIKGSTLAKHIDSVIAGKANDSAFNFTVTNAEQVGRFMDDPELTVVELSISSNIKTTEAQLGQNEKDFFGAPSTVYGTKPRPVYELTKGIPFNKVMSEIKLSVPVWMRVWLAHRMGVPVSDLPVLSLRPGFESRPEIDIKGIPAGAKVTEQFVAQVNAGMNQSSLRLQVVTSDPEALLQAIKGNAELGSLAGRYDKDRTFLYVPRGPQSGMRLSSVKGEPARLHFTDLAGREINGLNPSVMNTDVTFNKRATPDYWIDRLLLWPIKDRAGTNRVGEWVGETRLGRRFRPQPHYLPGPNFYKPISDANETAAKRVTASISPLNLPDALPYDVRRGIPVPELRAAYKSKGGSDGLSAIMRAKDAHTFQRYEIPGAQKTMFLPKWLADTMSQASSGVGTIWPKGATSAMTELLEHFKLSIAMHPERWPAQQAFRQDVLPGLAEGNTYLSRAQVEQINAFLATQA